MIDIKKLIEEVGREVRDVDHSVHGDEARYMDDYIYEATVAVKKVSYSEKLSYAKANPLHLVQALEEMHGPDASVGDLLNEMVFMQIA